MHICSPHKSLLLCKVKKNWYQSSKKLPTLIHQIYSVSSRVGNLQPREPVWVISGVYTVGVLNCLKPEVLFFFFWCMRYAAVFIPLAYGRAYSSTIDGYWIFIVRTDLKCMLCTRGQNTGTVSVCTKFDLEELLQQLAQHPAAPLFP